MAGKIIAVAMSGGVDSSTAALILKNAGWEPVGFTMRLWDRDRNLPDPALAPRSDLPFTRAFEDARIVAGLLDIPHHVVDFRKEFESTIVRPFIDTYLSGNTPSPCVRCNARMKFDRLVRMAEGVGATSIATGHYARVAYDEKRNRHLLLRARDTSKDQAYFLFELRQDQLEKAVLPIGDITKKQVRTMARRHGLPIADKSESQEICFIPDNNYAEFIERYYGKIMGVQGASRPFSPGTIIDTDGRVLGRHHGVHRFTVGQRRGLGIAHSSPLYVLEIDAERNRIIVGERSELGRNRCRVINPNWISIPELAEPLHVSAKIRSRHPEAPAVITPRDDGSVDVLFEEAQSAVCPGQACVFYQEEVVVGGGWISRD